MNLVTLCGRLTKDLEVRYGSGETPTAIGRFSLAVDDDFKKDSVDFINCVSFGKTTEILEKYTKKGSMILVVGKWQVRQWENSEGKKMYTNECVVNRVKLLDKKQDSTKKGENLPSEEGFYPVDVDIEDDDLPF